jgi:hypothetical protein
MQTTNRTTATLHGLPVLSPQAAAAAGYRSITQGVSVKTEDEILRGMARFSDPARTCWIATYPTKRELAVNTPQVPLETY